MTAFYRFDTDLDDALRRRAGAISLRRRCCYPSALRGPWLRAAESGEIARACSTHDHTVFSGVRATAALDG
jgi:hypothetical protein